jgi:hypothetical protein
MSIMGWSSSAMAKRYQHVTDPLLHETARKVSGLLWTKPDVATKGAARRAP